LICRAVERLTSPSRPRFLLHRRLGSACWKRLGTPWGPTAAIRIDSNTAYSLAEARRIAIEALDIRNFEDAVASFEAMAALRASTAIPIGVHTPDLRRAVNFGAPDAFCTDV
jgi:L-alanine-DL-glutamate epimerase-like enolase superfamily enzyme